MDEDDYESLPPTSTLTTHLVAGAAAGIMEHSIMYPVDCVKVCITYGRCLFSYVPAIHLCANSVPCHVFATSVLLSLNQMCFISPCSILQTRMQCLVPDPKASYRNVVDALYSIVRYEGVRNTVRGLNAVVYGAGPAHAMYFACYEKIKKSLSQKDSTNRVAQG